MLNAPIFVTNIDAGIARSNILYNFLPVIFSQNHYRLTFFFQFQISFSKSFVLSLADCVKSCLADCSHINKT